MCLLHSLLFACAFVCAHSLQCVLCCRAGAKDNLGTAAVNDLFIFDTGACFGHFGPIPRVTEASRSACCWPAACNWRSAGSASVLTALCGSCRLLCIARACAVEKKWTRARPTGTVPRPRAAHSAVMIGKLMCAVRCLVL